MLLSDELLSIISPEPTSYIDFSDTKARSFFEEVFADEWEKSLHYVANEYYSLWDEELDDFFDTNPNPLTTFETGNGFRAVFDDPYIIDQYDSRAWPAESSEAIENTLACTKAKFPDIKYSGCIQYAWSDTHCGECEKWEIGEDKIHDFVADTIDMVAYDPYFWEEVLDCEDVQAIKEELLKYKEFLSEETLEKINDLKGN